jgi:hypothetical protein
VDDDPFRETKFWSLVFMLSWVGLFLAIWFGLWQEKKYNAWMARKKAEANKDDKGTRCE